MGLFEAGRHRVPGRQLETEGHYEFLNRVESPVYGRARDLLEEWYSRYATEPGSDATARERLCKAFRSRDNRQVLAAFWELYLHESLRRCRFAPVVEPPLPSGRRIDFLCRAPNAPFYLEATIVGWTPEASAHCKRLAPVWDLLDNTENRDFWLDGVEVSSTSTTSPPVKRIAREVEAFLDGHDHDSVQADLDRLGFGAAPEFQRRWPLPGGELQVRFSIYPKGESRFDRQLRSMASRSGLSNAYYVGRRVESVQGRVQEKSAYGPLDAPLIVAVLDPVADLEDFEWALFGRPEKRGSGRFGSVTEPRARHVPGVLTARQLHPLAPSSWVLQQPALWINPWATSPTPALPFADAATFRPDGSIERLPSSVPARALFGLPKDWPGPGEVFPRSP